MHLVIYSGGMDSFTLLHHVIDAAKNDEDIGSRFGKRVVALTFNYGQRHAKEVGMASKVCAALGIEQRIMSLVDIFGQIGNGSALTDPSVDVPLGHYQAPTMAKTVVHGRNTIMLAVALGVAQSMQAENDTQIDTAIYYGAHSGDHEIYPDCRPGFVGDMRRAIWGASDERVVLRTPFLTGSKKTILTRGKSLGLTASDYAATWTCYQGGEHACGECGSCTERLEAFDAMGWEDPAMDWRRA